MAELNITYPDYPRMDLMAKQANALDQQYAMKQQDIDQEQATRNALSGMTSLGDFKNVLPALMKANPQLGITAMQHIATMDAATQAVAQKRRQEAAVEAQRLASSLLEFDDDTASRLYPQVAQQYKASYPEFADKVPVQWDRPSFQQVAGMGVSPEARMRNQATMDAHGLQRERFDYERQDVPVLDADGNIKGYTNPKSKILPKPSGTSESSLVGWNLNPETGMMEKKVGGTVLYQEPKNSITENAVYRTARELYGDDEEAKDTFLNLYHDYQKNAPEGQKLSRGFALDAARRHMTRIVESKNLERLHQNYRTPEEIKKAWRDKKIDENLAVRLLEEYHGMK